MIPLRQGSVVLEAKEGISHLFVYYNRKEINIPPSPFLSQIQFSLALPLTTT